MADISEEIAAFKGAVYGEEVRNAMVSLAEKVNTDATTVETVSTDYKRLKNTNLNMVTYGQTCYTERNGNSGIYIQCGDLLYLRGTLNRTLRFDESVVFVTSPKGVSNCIYLANNQVLYYNQTTSLMYICNRADIPNDDIGIIYYCAGNQIRFGAGYDYIHGNKQYEEMIYLDGDNEITYELADDGVYLSIPYCFSTGTHNLFFIRGLYSINVTNSMASDFSPVTSPSGKTDCIKISNAYALILHLTVPDTWSLMITGYDNLSPSDIVLLAVRRGKPIAGLLYRNWLINTLYYRDINDKIGIANNTPSDFSDAGVYIEVDKSNQLLFISNYQGFSANLFGRPNSNPFIKLGDIQLTTSTLGVANCIALNHADMLLYDVITNTLKIERDVSVLNGTYEKLGRQYTLLAYAYHGYLAFGKLEPYYDKWINHASNGKIFLSMVQQYMDFESDDSDLYLNLYKLYIRGVRTYNANDFETFRNSCDSSIIFEDSPSGRHNSIKLSHNYGLFYNATYNTFRVGRIGTMYNWANTDVLLFGAVNGTVLSGIGKQYYDKYVSDHSSSSSNSIIALNPNMESVLLQMNKRHNDGQNIQVNYPPIFTLLYFSDIHGSSYAAKRIKDVQTYFNQYLTDSICAGDMVTSRFSSGMDFWSDIQPSTLMVLGNHDVMSSEEYNVTQQHTEQVLYEQYFAPYIQYWGDENFHMNENTTWWYKDYPDHKIRLIGLNCMEYWRPEDTTYLIQEEFLRQTLSSTPSEYSVICTHHYGPGTNPSYELHSTFNSEWNYYSYPQMNNFTTIVQDWIDDGGNFICWLAGHTHYDQIGTTSLTNCTNQLYIITMCARLDNLNGPTARLENTKCGDAFNFISFDTVRKLIKMYRVGCDYDNSLRKKESVVISYDGTPRILYNNGLPISE